MKKKFIIFLIIFLAITVFSPLPIFASEYSESHCPKIIKVEDSLGNVGVNGNGIKGSFIKGTVNTITVKITATDPQGLPLYYQFLFGYWMKVDGTEMTNWVTENTTTLDVSNANIGANQSNWIRIDNQDGYGCLGAYYDTQANFMYEVYPPGVSCSSFTYSNWDTCSNSGEQTRSAISSSPNGCIGGAPVLSQSCNSIPIQVTPPIKTTKQITTKKTTTTTTPLVINNSNSNQTPPDDTGCDSGTGFSSMTGNSCNDRTPATPSRSIPVTSQTPVTVITPQPQNTSVASTEKEIIEPVLKTQIKTVTPAVIKTPEIKKPGIEIKEDTSDTTKLNQANLDDKVFINSETPSHKSLWQKIKVWLGFKI
ncbi:MAG: hypothetical protein NTV03_00295 [Candidatus Nomurabacteria bacterium]|nr:hypothetical protein [Candidatus Nomurabacteria bacterium]